MYIYSVPFSSLLFQKHEKEREEYPDGGGRKQRSFLCFANIECPPSASLHSI